MTKVLNIFIYIIFIVVTISIPAYNNAKEILVYADSITYDDEENLIARGNAKIFKENEFIFSDVIIYNKKEEKIILPTKFTFKDENGNYFQGENGYFQRNLNFAEFENPKIKYREFRAGLCQQRFPVCCCDGR